MSCGRILRTALGALLVAVFLALTVAARAEVPPAIFPNESRPTAARLAEARKRIDDKKWTEAIDELQAILDTAGNDLVALSPRYCVPARRQCHLLLASLPPDALKTYRGRMEPQARKWLEQGLANRDVKLLPKVVDEAFCTRSGETALDALGDLAFERGRFEEAEFWWLHLAPKPEIKPDAIDPKTDLIYPDPQGSLALIHAKQVLARIFRAPANNWTPLLHTYRERHADAEGTLAGRKGKYADLLAEIAAKAKTGDANADVVWSTFGGDATRGLVVPAQPRLLDGLERLCRRGPTFTFDLEPGMREAENAPPLKHAAPSEVARAMAFHPLIVGDHAVVADAWSVTALDLHTGKSEEWFDLLQHAAFATPSLRLPLPEDLLDLRYTLTLADDCLYARLGAQKVFRADDVDKNDAARLRDRDKQIASFLVCLSTKPGLKDKRLRWLVRPVVQPGKPDRDQKNAIFEGAPVVHQGQVYIAATYFENDRTVTAVLCYPTTAEGTPTPRWTQVVCETHELPGREKRPRHHLLTVAGPNIVYCSHSGAIVALDALTGKPSWAVRYPSRGEREMPPRPVLRDLSPPVYADGKLYVAPTDYDHLLCLDPLTGQTIWDREHLEPTHLLGVGQGRLLFTTLHGLRAVGAADGSDAEGWLLPDGGGERPPSGRGLLLGDEVLWPTSNGVVVCDQRDGVVSYRPTLGTRVPVGNLVYANGSLVVADRTKLYVFAPPAMVLEKRKEQVKEEPDAPGRWLDLARSEADAGRLEEALESLKKGQALDPGRGLHNELQRETLDVLLLQARRTGDKENWQTAEDAIIRAVAGQSAQTRLEMLVRTAEMWEEVRQPARAAAVWQTILGADDLRSQGAFPFSRTQLTAGLLALERGDRLKKAPRDVPNLPRPLPKNADEPPALPLPLARKWEIQLAADEHFLPVAGSDDLLLTARPGQLLAYATDTGKPRWKCKVSFQPEWAAKVNDAFVTAGPQAAACVRMEDGKVVWQVPAPSLFAGQGPDTMSSFQIANRRFLFLAGGKWLFALDAETGKLLWSQSAPGAGLELPAPSGRFNPALVVRGDTALLQPSPNRTVLLDAATGKPLRSLTVANGDWWRPPLAREDFALCFAPNARTIVQMGATTGQTLWEHSITEATTLTGEPPRLIGEKKTLLTLIATNLGDQLQRLEPATGKPLWAQPVLLSGKSRPVEPSGWALDDNAVYFTQSNRLYARALADGKVLWDKPIDGPNVPYETRRLQDCLLTYPTETGTKQIQFRFLNGSLQWQRGGQAAGYSFPLLCSDPKTGQLIQRVNVSPSPPSVGVALRKSASIRFFPRIEVRPVETDASKPVVQVTARGIVVAVGDRIWALKSDK